MISIPAFPGLWILLCYWTEFSFASEPTPYKTIAGVLFFLTFSKDYYPFDKQKEGKNKQGDAGEPYWVGGKISLRDFNKPRFDNQEQ